MQTNLLSLLNVAAKKYSAVCNNDLLYIAISSNKNNLFMFESMYKESHFQHLCGIHSETMPGKSFYFACLNGTTLLSDCTPAYNHNFRDIKEKTESLIKLLEFSNMKFERAGKHLSGVGNIDFDFAVGDSSFIGYKIDARTKMCFPLTNMIAPIADYCVNPKRVSLILSKSYDKDLYDTVEYEASKNLLGKIDIDVAESISAFLDTSLLQKTKIPNVQITKGQTSLSDNALLDEIDVMHNGENERER